MLPTISRAQSSAAAMHSSASRDIARIVAATSDAQQDFEFFLVRDNTINAFAMPGGFWLPRSRRRAGHGSLTFDEDGVRLLLSDPLRAPNVRERGIVSGSGTSG